MRTVAFRELLREPKKIFPIPVEGIEVVRREGNFYIYPKANEPIVRQKEITLPLKIPEEVMTYKGDAPMIGWCQIHFEKGKNYPLREIIWEDENGTVVVERKLACPKCVERYKSMGRGKLTFTAPL